MQLQQQLTEQLAELHPVHLEVSNESAGHGGYFPCKESHFKLLKKIIKADLKATHCLMLLS